MLEKQTDALIDAFELFVRQQAVSIGSWKPKPQECFDNVKAWVEHNPAHKAVWGFVYLDRLLTLGCHRFVPHAVVEVEDGSLMDITPYPVFDPQPFIRYTGTFDDFGAIVTLHAQNRVRLDLIP